MLSILSDLLTAWGLDFKNWGITSTSRPTEKSVQIDFNMESKSRLHESSLEFHSYPSPWAHTPDTITFHPSSTTPHPAWGQDTRSPAAAQGWSWFIGCKRYRAPLHVSYFPVTLKQDFNTLKKSFALESIFALSFLQSVLRLSFTKVQRLFCYSALWFSELHQRYCIKKDVPLPLMAFQ